MASLEAAPVLSAKRTSCLRPWRRLDRPRLRIVCFPWCGAGASVYRRMANAFPVGAEVLAVQWPGREDRFSEPPLKRMDVLVDHVLRELVPVSEVPLVLFGHSMGAVVAHAVARSMSQRFGREPALLVVSGHGAPHHMQLDRTIWHNANDEDLLRNLGELGGTPGALLADPTMMRMLLPPVRADYEVLETYQCKEQPLLSCPLVACAGDEDDAVTASGLQAWSALTCAPSRTHWFSGGHFYLRDDAQPLMRQLAHWIHELAAPGLVATP